MEKHHRDLAGLRTKFESGKEALRTELHAKLLSKQDTLWEAMRQEILAREVDERMRIRECESGLEREAQRRYAIAVKEQINVSSGLRAELEEQRRVDMPHLKLENLLTRADKHLTTTRMRLKQERRMSTRLLDLGQSVVTKARLADQAIWSNEIVNQSNILIAGAVVEATENFDRRRDIAIDATIREAQISAVAWEKNEAQAAHVRFAHQRRLNLIAVAAQRAQRSEWVSRYLATVRNAQTLREQRSGFQSTERTGRYRRDEAKVQVEDPRSRAKFHVENLENVHLEQRFAHLAMVNNLASSCAAAGCAADSMATRLECLSAGYIHESVQCEKERQTELMTKNGAVKLEFHAIETEMLKLADIIHIEHARHSHLSSLLSSYKRCYSIMRD